MRANCQPLVAAVAAGIVGLSSAALAQSPDTATAQPSPASSPGAAAPSALAASPEAANATAPAVPQKKTYTVPAGTKVLLTLRSAVNTKSGKPGDGV